MEHTRNEPPIFSDQFYNLDHAERFLSRLVSQPVDWFNWEKKLAGFCLEPCMLRLAGTAKAVLGRLEATELAQDLLGRTRVIVSPESFEGYCEGSGDSQAVYFDADFLQEGRRAEAEVTSLIAHEISHFVRFRLGVGVPPDTLGRLVVEEGVAGFLERTISGYDWLAPLQANISEQQMSSSREFLVKHWNSVRTIDHQKLFASGDPAMGVPAGVGYMLARSGIETWCVRHRVTDATLIRTVTANLEQDIHEWVVSS